MLSLALICLALVITVAVLFIEPRDEAARPEATAEAAAAREAERTANAAIEAALEAMKARQGADGATPTEIANFLQTHPELGLDVRRVVSLQDWADGRRWRADTTGGASVVFYERDGQITSVRDAETGLVFIWRADSR